MGESGRTTLGPMSEMPAGSNFFVAIETNLGVDVVTAAYER
jgi:hypothetical protein